VTFFWQRENIRMGEKKGRRAASGRAHGQEMMLAMVKEVKNRGGTVHYFAKERRGKERKQASGGGKGGEKPRRPETFLSETYDPLRGEENHLNNEERRFC